MRHAVPFVLLFCAAGMNGSAGDWDSWRDGRRVLLVRAASPDDPRFRQQEVVLAADPEGLALRDVLVVRWVGGQNHEVRLPDGKAVSAGALAGLFPGLRTADWRVLLIGRDGEVKIAWDGTVPLAEVLAALAAGA